MHHVGWMAKFAIVWCMKAFLTSHNLEKKHFDRFRELTGQTKVPKALFITTAVVPYGLNPRPEWVDESLDDMKQFAEVIEETTLEEDEHIAENLDQYGFIFVTGGNAFYLAYRFAETGFDKRIKKYIEDGGVYSGSSAGAIILMDDFEAFAPADDPSAAPKTYPGLSMIDFAFVPHADSPKYGPIMEKIAKVYQKKGYEVILLNDNQVLIIDGDKKEVI